MATAITYSWVDATGKTSHNKVHIPSIYSTGQVASFIAASAQIFANASSAGCTLASAGIEIDLSGLTLRTIAETFADVWEKAMILARGAVSSVRARFNIPTLDPQFVLAGTKDLDQSAPEVDAVLEVIVDGVTYSGETLDTVDLRGNDLTTIGRASKNFLASQR